MVNLVIDGIELYNFKHTYLISKCGKVYNTKTKIFLKLTVGKNGYYNFSLSVNGKVKDEYLHRAIATTFIPNPLNKPCINHIDGNKLNNSLSNLEWVTYKENENHAIKVLGKDNGKHMKGKMPSNTRYNIKQYTLDGELVAIYETTTEAKKLSNGYYNPSKINAVIDGSRNHHRGYKWKL